MNAVGSRFGRKLVGANKIASSCETSLASQVQEQFNNITK